MLEIWAGNNGSDAPERSAKGAVSRSPNEREKGNSEGCGREDERKLSAVEPERERVEGGAELVRVGGK
jgi:hypothetical protein